MQLLAKYSHVLSIALVFIFSIFTWMVFQPGFMNADAIVIYNQAVSGVYEDWHPPIMAFTLKFFLNIGLDIQHLMFLQSQLAYFGLFILIYHLIQILKIKSPYFKSLLVLLLFSLPLSPFPFYAMGFIKDSWCMISFLWIVGVSIYLYRIQSKSSSKFKTSIVLISLITFMVLSILSRHNAIVLLPIYLILIYYLGRIYYFKKVFIFLFCLLPIALWFSFNHYAYTIKQVKHEYPERQVMAAELVGLLAIDSTKCNSMNYICNHLSPNWKENYVYGEVYPVMPWGWKHSVSFPDFDRDNPGLEKDYYQSLKSYPFSMLWVKIKSFWHMIKPSKSKYWFHVQLDDNSHGLKQNLAFSYLREKWINLSLALRKPLNMIVADHFFWLLTNMIFLIYFYRKKLVDNKSGLFTIFLLIPFTYYFSYLLAATNWNYRFMYPSTLIVQLTLVSLIIKYIQERRSRKVT